MAQSSIKLVKYIRHMVTIVTCTVVRFGKLVVESYKKLEKRTEEIGLNLNETLNIVIEYMINSQRTVSYTHLDVYKRQV